MMALVFVLIFSFAFGGPKIVVEKAWVREVPPVSKTTAVFMVIRNEGDEGDVLFSVSSPVAEKAEIHETYVEGEVMKMRRLERLEIPPGSEVVLRPMGKHVMLIGLKGPLSKGKKVKVILFFEKSGKVTVEAEVGGPE